mgnify:CR=1 FL=1
MFFSLVLLLLLNPRTAFTQGNSSLVTGTFLKGDDTLALIINQTDSSIQMEERTSHDISGVDLELKQYLQLDNSIKFTALTFFWIGDSISFKGEIVKHDLKGVLSVYKSGQMLLTYSLGDSANDRSLSNNNSDTTEPVSIGLLILMGIIFLAALFITRAYLAKLNAKLYVAPIPVVDDPESYFPMVRFSRVGFFRHRVVIVYENGIAAFKKWKSTSIASLHENGSEENLKSFKGIGKVKMVQVDAVLKIIISPYRLTRKSTITLKTSEGSFSLTLPNYECDIFIRVLQTKFPGKLKYSSGNIVVGIITALMVTSLMVGFFFQEQKSGTTLSWWVPAIIWLNMLFIVGLLPIAFAKYDLYKAAGNYKNKPRKIRDLSHNKPIRSNALAMALRLIVGAFIVYFLVAQPGFLNLPMVVVIAGILLLLSIALAQKATDKLQKNDTRKPILYLRSFLDDNETTLNPCTHSSTLLGIDPPYYWLSNHGLEEGLRYKIGRFVIKYGYSFWPTKLIRLFFGIVRDTSEEQLTEFFKTKGLVVAIGKPGEKIVTLGASRMYVTNEEWQQTVLDLLKESQIVLLQPSTTDGVWWEIDKVLKKVNPENIILCMVNYKYHQEYYENFCRRFKAIRPDIQIPRSLGNEKKISFITFDKEWKPNIVYLQYHSIFRWPFTGNALNFKKTFKDYFAKRVPVI